MSRTPIQLSLFARPTISASRVASIIGSSVDTVYRLIEEGELHGYRLTARGWWNIYYDSFVAYCLRMKLKYDNNDSPDQQHSLHN